MFSTRKNFLSKLLTYCNKITDEENNKDLLRNETMITSALGMALCYVNRIQKKYSLADSVSYRILVIKASEDSSNQYMNFMNNIFSAEKLVKNLLKTPNIEMNQLLT